MNNNGIKKFSKVKRSMSVKLSLSVDVDRLNLKDVFKKYPVMFSVHHMTFIYLTLLKN